MYKLMRLKELGIRMSPAGTGSLEVYTLYMYICIYVYMCIYIYVHNVLITYNI